MFLAVKDLHDPLDVLIQQDIVVRLLFEKGTGVNGAKLRAFWDDFAA
jgi:hypothetical protein